MDIQRKCFEESNNVNPDWSFKFDEELQQYIALDSEMELQVDEFNELWDAFRAGWQAAKAQAVPKWISVKDKLPKEKQWVLIRVACSDYFNVEQGMYRGDERWMNCWCANRHNDLYPVTHWMPLPDAPQEPAND